MRTHAWRAYETLDRAHWSRLAAAITFLSFLALFPLITVAAAVAPRSSATASSTGSRRRSASRSPASPTN